MPVYTWDIMTSSYRPVSGGQSVTPVAPMAYGVLQMDTDIANNVPVYWAHRGGSANWSEMTMHAYNNAVDHGVKAIEFSARRTSDGVWVGMHDPTVDRVTSLSGPVSSFTWDQLDEVPVDVPASGGFVTRLDEFLSSFPDKLLIVDPKNSGFVPESLIPMLQAVPNWQNQVIFKLDGQWERFSTFEQAKSAGFKVAAYWYPDNYAANISSRIDYVDYVGMQYDATQFQWDELLSYGKPIWGHVLYSQAQADASLAAGASILQCADVVEIIPPSLPL